MQTQLHRFRCLCETINPSFDVQQQTQRQTKHSLPIVGNTRNVCLKQRVKHYENVKITSTSKTVVYRKVQQQSNAILLLLQQLCQHLVIKFLMCCSIKPSLNNDMRGLSTVKPADEKVGLLVDLDGAFFGSLGLACPPQVGLRLLLVAETLSTDIKMQINDETKPHVVPCEDQQLLFEDQQSVKMSEQAMAQVFHR
jgi:hypothetical protein